MPLTPRLPFHADEAPMSWAARLAALHTGGSAAGFLQDIGIDPWALAEGDPGALRALAAAGDADPAALARNAVQRLAGDLVRCRGEVFDRRFVRRRRRVCPLCLVEDSGDAAMPDASRLRVRLAWTLHTDARAAGIDALEFRDLRGTAVVMLSSAGLEVPQIASITGHRMKSAFDILERYGARNRAVAKAAVLRLENAPETVFANRLQTTTTKAGNAT